MRVLILGSRHPWRMEAAIERALRRAGHDTLILDDRRTKHRLGWRLTQRWIERRAAWFAPDFVILSKCLALDLATVKRIIRGKPNVMWYHDPQWHSALDRPDIAHIAAMGRLSSVFFITGFADEWRAHGLPAKYLPAAGDAGITPVPPEPGYASDLAFIGTGYDPSRAELLARVAAELPLKVWGLGWEQWQDRIDWGGRPVEGHDFAAVCSSAKITLGVNPAQAAGGVNYTSDRTWMVMLAGAFYLGQGTPGMMELLRDGEHCIWYTDAASCLERARYYLKYDVERERIRRAGEQFVRAHHTYDQRIVNLLAGTEFSNPLEG